MLAVHIPQKLCEDQLLVVEPQINAEGIHMWPFDPGFPIEVRFMTIGLGHNVRKNRHDYFELAYLCRGAANLEIQDRSLPLQQGDLAVVGSTLYHRFDCRSNSPATLAVLFFQPDLIRADGGPDNAEYLTPFLLQDPNFPHVIAAKGSILGQIFDLMQRIRAELPATSPRARLAAKNNRPFLITGDNPHALIGMGSIAEAETYFADRQAHGFNAVWMNMLVATPAYYDSRDDGSIPDGIRPFTAYITGGTDSAHYDLTKPNEAYFARVDEMITAAANHGLVVFLDPIDTCCRAAPARTVWLQALLNNGLTAAGWYGKYLGERFRPMQWTAYR